MKYILILQLLLITCYFHCFSHDYKEVNHVRCEKLTEKNHHIISENTLSFIKQQRILSNDFPEIKISDSQFEFFIIYNELASEDRIICAIEKSIFDSSWYIILHENQNSYNSNKDIHIIDTGTLQRTNSNRQFSYLDSLFDSQNIPSTEFHSSTVKMENKKNVFSFERILLILLLIFSVVDILRNKNDKKK